MMEKTIPLLFKTMVEKYPDYAAQYSKDRSGQFRKTSYRELAGEVAGFSAGLASIGVKRGDHVGILSDNRKEWLIADLAILSLGAADVPRGCDTMASEAAYILGFPECRTVLVENETQLEKVLSVKSRLPVLSKLVVLDPEYSPVTPARDEVKILTFEEVMSAGKRALAEKPGFWEEEIAKGDGEDTATIIFTSGTTGEPKGVMLSHRNFLFQVNKIPQLIEVGPGDIWLSILPVWHSFERIMQYVTVYTASALAYSKPIGKIMLADMEAIKPTWMASVPRIWEAVKAGVERNVRSHGGIKYAMFRFFVSIGGTHAYLSDMLRGLLPQFHRRNRLLDIIVSILPFLLLYPLRLLGNALVFAKIKAKLGGRFVAGISGGGALPHSVDTFFAAAGVLLLEGYGLTETAPVLAVRKQRQPVRGTVGPMIPDTEVKIVDETGNVLPPGRKGLILVRGGQVMQGYYRRPDLTEKVLSPDGWLNTGDLGMLTHRGELKITGRAKDTIVLLGGENVEPAPIEERLRESRFVEQAMVVGQDKKYLAALIVPNGENLEQFARESNIPYMDTTELVSSAEVQELIQSEINSLVNGKNGFRNFEQIYRFKLIPKSFEVGKELSAKQEMKRHVISEMYAKEIAELFK